MKKIFRESEKYILGFFVGCIVMIISFAFLFWSQTLNFKDIVTPLVGSLTFLFAVFTSIRVLQWYEVKKNDKGFEMAQNVVIATYSCFSLIKRLERTIEDLRPLLLHDKMTEFHYSRLKEIKEKERDEFIKHHTLADASVMSLMKWGVDKKDGIVEPLNGIIDSYEKYMKFINKVLNKIISTEEIELEYESFYMSKNNTMVIMMEYTPLKINDIYEFNN